MNDYAKNDHALELGEMAKSKARLDWQDAELKLMAEKFPVIGPFKTAKLLGRSESAIIQRAYKMGLRYDGSGDWSKSEEEFLTENHQRLTTKELATALHKQEKVVHVKLQQLGFRIGVHADLTGKQFGFLTVLRRGKKPKGFWCRCICGKEKEVSMLNIPRTSSCGCRGGKRSLNYKGYEDISSKAWGLIKRNAKTRGLEFGIEIQYAWDLFVKQGRKCNLSGVPIAFPQWHDEIGTASLDRIDSSKGYVEGNVQWLHRDVNQMKWSTDIGRFVEMCRKIADHAGSKENVYAV